MSGFWSDPDRAQRWNSNQMGGNPIRAPHLELLLGLLEDVGAGWCLDLGCGSGLVAELVLDRHPGLRVFGVDGSGPMLEMATERLARFGDRVRLAEADLADTSRLRSLDPPTECAAAIAVQALHHLHRPELEAVAGWTRERLRPGGLFAVMDPVLAPSGPMYAVYRRAKQVAGWKWNPDTFEEYAAGLAQGHDRPLRLDDYLAVIRSGGFEAACLDLRADRAFLIGRR